MEITIDKLTLEQLRQFNPGLVKEIQEGVDKDQALVDLQGKVDELETENKGLKTEKETLEQQVKDLETEKDELEKKKDELEVAEALRTKKERISELLKEAKLPKEAITERLHKELEKAEDEDEMKEIIEDRKEWAATNKPQVSGAGDEFRAEGEVEEDGEGKKKAPTEDEVQNVREAFISRRTVSERPPEK